MLNDSERIIEENKYWAFKETLPSSQTEELDSFSSSIPLPLPATSSALSDNAPSLQAPILDAFEQLTLLIEEDDCDLYNSKTDNELEETTRKI